MTCVLSLMLNFCKFPSSKCTDCSVRLLYPVNSIFKSEEDLTSFDEFMPLFKTS